MSYPFNPVGKIVYFSPKRFFSFKGRFLNFVVSEEQERGFIDIQVLNLVESLALTERGSNFENTNSSSLIGSSSNILPK